VKPDLPWWWRTGDALSQLFNAAVLGGSSNESVSGRASRIVRWDNPLQDNHCDEAYLGDLARAERYTTRHKIYTELGS